MKNFQNKTKIIKVSRVLSIILSAGIFVWILAAICFFTGIVIPILILPAVRAGLHSDPQKAYLTCGTILWAWLGFIVNLKLFRFFDRLKDGHLFDAQTVGNLDAAGKWWIVLWLYDVLFHEVRLGVFQISDDWNPISLDILSFGSLFAGLVLIFVAWLLKEAQGLQEEQELTV